MQKTLVVPCLHINGSSRGTLLEALQDAVNALQVAQEALGATAPHGRDYYPIDKGETYGASFTDARAQYYDRQARLMSVTDELLAIWEAVTDGQSGNIVHECVA